MDQDKVFKEIDRNNNSLWVRIQMYADELNLQPEDEAIFVTDEQAKLSFYINNYIHNLVSIGVHVARVKKIRQQLEDKKARVFGYLYVEVTDEGIKGRNSSKFDKEYRTGKVLQNDELRELIKLVSDVQELEGILESVKNALHTKSMILPTLFKLDKYNF